MAKGFAFSTATRADWMEGYPTGAKVAEVKRWHVEDNGWSDIGYHFLIDRDGTGLVTREEFALHACDALRFDFGRGR